MERGVESNQAAAGSNGYRRPRPPLPATSSGVKLPANINMNNTNNGSSGNNNNNNENESMVRDQDRLMPVANISRIMRKILPPHSKISEDAKESVQECVSEFISFITGEANDRCQKDHRKTVTAEDILWAMSRLGFDDYLEPLTLYLNRYRELEGDHGAMMKRAVQVVHDPNGGLNMMGPSTYGPPMGGFPYQLGRSVGFNPQMGGGGGHVQEDPPNMESQVVSGINHHPQYAHHPKNL